MELDTIWKDRGKELDEIGESHMASDYIQSRRVDFNKERWWKKIRSSWNVVLPKNAADKLDGEKDKRAYCMNFKQDANSLPKLSKEKWLSFDMHAETIGVILLRHAFSECRGKEERGEAVYSTLITLRSGYLSGSSGGLRGLKTPPRTYPGYVDWWCDWWRERQNSSNSAEPEGGMSRCPQCSHRVSRSDGQLASLHIVKSGTKQRWTKQMLCTVQ